MTKIKRRFKEAYLRALKRSGYQSFRSANLRRFELINLKTGKPVDEGELNKLNRVVDLYVKYKTNDQIGRAVRSIKGEISHAR